MPSYQVPHPYKITEVAGLNSSADIERFNKAFPDDFLPLTPWHLAHGYWWLVTEGPHTVGFAGSVPFTPFEQYGYFKRVAILPDHRGNGLQKHLILAAEQRAIISTEWTHMVSSCHYENMGSANSFISCGYKLCRPERPWEPESLFWIKPLQRA